MARDLLKVVQDQQAGAAPGDRMADLRDRVFAAQWQVQALGHGISQAINITRYRQIAKPHATGKVAQRRPTKARRQPGLAGAAHAQQRHQSGAGIKAARQLGQRRLSADERIALGRQAVADGAQRQPHVDAGGGAVGVARSSPADHAIGLVHIRRGDKRRLLVADLEQRQRLRQPLEAPMAMGHDPLGRPANRHPRGVGEQNLPAQRRRHDPCRDQLGQAVNLQRLGAQCDIGGRGLAQRHRADMQAAAGHQRRDQRRQRPVVVQGIAKCVGGGVKQQQKTVGLVDLSAAPGAQQVARQTVVFGAQRRHRDIAQTRRQRGAVDQIGQQQGAGIGHGRQYRPAGSPAQAPMWVCTVAVYTKCRLRPPSTASTCPVT